VVGRAPKTRYTQRAGESAGHLFAGSSTECRSKQLEKPTVVVRKGLYGLGKEHEFEVTVTLDAASTQ
jgi:hypothetical protein